MTAFLASLAGALWFAYIHVTDSDTIVRAIRSQSPKYFKQGWVDLARARLRWWTGEVNLSDVRLMQVVDGVPFQVVRIPWLHVQHDPRALIEGRIEPSAVAAAHCTLRLVRRKDGTWNLRGLFAGKPIVNLPPIHIQNGTIELADNPDPKTAPVAILRDVSLNIKPTGKGKIAFEGNAKGDMFEKTLLEGTVDLVSGRVQLHGGFDRLTIAEPLRGRVPPEYREGLDGIGLTGGEIDLGIKQLVIDPGAKTAIRYDVVAHLRAGTWHCPKLPFPLNDVRARFTVKDGVVNVGYADGVYGATSVRVDRALFTPGDPEHAPMDLKMEVFDLKLDDRLRRWTPAQLAPLWDQYQPSGRVNLAVDATRKQAGSPLRHKLTVTCLDVGMIYEHFKYPVEHISGQFVWEGDRVDVLGLETMAVGGQPLSAKGVILHPGPDADVHLDFEGQALPINKLLLDALPKDVLKAVKDFNPTGTVKGALTLRRTPPERPGDDPIGKVAVDAVLDLNERCGITWVGLPYPVSNLTGRLEIHPDRWLFQNMKGFNGQAEISGSGQVKKLPGSDDQLKVDLKLKAVKLPFDDQLRESLEPAWQKSWAVLRPNGSCDVDAQITVRPGIPDDIKLVIVPRPSTGINLQYTRDPRPGDPGGTYSLRMEDVTGKFLFNNGPVDMTNVTFRFYGTPIRFATGRVVVEDDGQFDIKVQELEVKEIRLDPTLQQIMPPVMQQFAQRLDDGRAFTLKGNMGLAWSGVAGKSVLCTWDNTRVIFIDNSIRSSSGLTLEHIQGQLDKVWGRADSESFEIHGALALDSVGLLGQQITNLESPLDVENNVARLDRLHGNLLAGELSGKLSISLDATPHYTTSLTMKGADLDQYARTLPGHQTFRGKVNAQLDLDGFGGDLHTLQGSGEGHLVEGDLGTLPVYLQVFKLLTLSPATKTAFDSADVAVTIQNGKTYFAPVRFTGDAFSLQGRGTMDVQGDLDLRLQVLYGRDRFRLWLLNDALREASGQIMMIRVHGSPSNPKLKLEALPGATDVVKSAFGQRKERRIDRLARELLRP
jgi:hypothetical protein